MVQLGLMRNPIIKQVTFTEFPLTVLHYFHSGPFLFSVGLVSNVVDDELNHPGAEKNLVLMV